MTGHAGSMEDLASRPGESADPGALASAGVTADEDLPGAPMLGLIFLVALLVACGIVRATVYGLTGY